MKIYRSLKMMFFALFLQCCNYSSFAQGMGNAKIVEVKMVGNIVKINIESSEPFYVGANIYYLRIGEYECKNARQLNIYGKGYLEFEMPLIDYRSLIEGQTIYMYYGEILKEIDSETYESVCNSNPERCKFLGLFSTKSFK